MSIVLTEKNSLNINKLDEGFEITYSGLTLLSHTSKRPMLFVGYGEESVEMYRGNFDIQDYVIERSPLRFSEVAEVENEMIISFSKQQSAPPSLKLKVSKEDSRLKIEFVKEDPTINRLWFRIQADDNEKVYGCGEQLSYFNMRGKNFPLWTSEPGVGRNKKTYTTWQADVKDKAGGDYYNTNYPQPTYVSSKKYYCHVETTAYADFDFRNKAFHELQIWDVPSYILIETAPSFEQLVEKISGLFGRQPNLPDWVYDGIILGIQGGTEIVEQKIQKALDKGIKVAGVWCQDWQGKRITSFGKRLMWNWKWNPEEYPNLDSKIHQWKEQGIRFLGYINPYLAVEGDLYKEAKEKSYLALNDQGETYLVDFGEFYCGIVDFTNEEACTWYKKVIKENMIDFGLDGWMADFGEYLPTDVHLQNGESAMLMHNAWPTKWAKVNYEAVEEAGKLEEIVYFMRAGYTGIQKYCTLLWGGDQSVNWSLDDGLASVVPAALSAGMLGNGLHHSDIGGYTSLHGNIRSKELFMRWAEMGAFTPFMRTHEGNRPDENFQYDQDDEAMDHLARMTQVFVALAPYTKEMVKQNAEKGTPVQRPLFMHYEEDKKSYEIQYEYLYGRDLLVAPVHQEDRKTWEVYLPADEWVHLWTGTEYSGGDIEVSVPLGYPAVFYRKQSPFVELFRDIAKV